MKDYYSILECTPMSTRDEIKRNFRRLAQQFHPDKNAENAYATARFHDIKEAYETLTQPAKKNAWLQERWLQQVMNKHVGEVAPLTPYLILGKVLQLEKYMSAADIFRMDQFGMIAKMEDLLSEENRDCLRTFNEPEVNRRIISHLISSARSFPFPLLQGFIEKLELAAGDDQESHQYILQFKKDLKARHKKESYTLPLILLVTTIICLIIYVAGKQ